MDAKIKYTDEPLGDVKVIADALPSPAELAFNEEGIKTPLALNKIRRKRFALRLSFFILVSLALLIATKVGAFLLMNQFEKQQWPIYLFFVGGITGALWLIAFAAFNMYFFVVKAAIPRLTDIGVYGPMRTFIIILVIASPLSILILLCMLLALSNCISSE